MNKNLEQLESILHWHNTDSDTNNSHILRQEFYTRD